MKRLKSPTTFVLYPGQSQWLQAFHSELRQKFRFTDTSEQLPIHLAGGTAVRVRSGHVECLTDPVLRKSTWEDPLENKDIVLITSNEVDPSIATLRETLQFCCPVESAEIVTVLSVPSRNIEHGHRISIVCSREEDAATVDSRLKLYVGNRLEGTPAILLGVARELDQRAFAIVIEHPTDSLFPSTSAIKAAMNAFSQLSGIDLCSGKLSDQAIRMRKHLKDVYQKQQSEYQSD